MLVRRSLLRRETVNGLEPRYQMLESVRAYALERLRHSDEQLVVARAHAEYMLDLAEQAAATLDEVQQALWLERLQRDHDNLAEALHWTLQHGELATSLRLARALWRFWWRHGHLSEGMAWLDQVLALASAVDDDPLLAAVLNGAGVLAHALGADERATLLLSESLDLWRELGADVEAAAVVQDLAALERDTPAR
jgi:non-specific serine/threonine protein kinase